MKQYIVDAFTNKPFSGNPAAVCVMDEWPSEESMMKLANDFFIGSSNRLKMAEIVRRQGLKSPGANI